MQFTSGDSIDDEVLETTQSPAMSSSQAPSVPAAATLATMMTTLTREAGSAGLTLADASQADPGRLTFPSEETRAFEWKKQVVGLASSSFPVKYAHFVEATAQLMATSQPRSTVANKEVVTLSIRRERVFQDSIEALVSISPQSMRSAAIRIHFCDEAGVDAGGLQREWFVMLNQSLASNGGVFYSVNAEEPAFYLNASSASDLGEHHLAYFYGTGRLIGRALLEGNVMGFHLSLPLLKVMLGIPVAFSDLQYFEPETYKSLVWLEENQDVKALGLTFSITESGQDKEEILVDLIPNGRHVDVTDDNKHQYLERRFRHTLFESVSSQLYAFLKGLYEGIPQELLLIFDPEELDYLLCGSDEIDVDEWENHTICSDDLQDHKALIWFWETVREMPNEYRRRLLHFTTGASRVPVTGFSALTSYDGRLSPFTLKGVPLMGDGHVWSHACFNSLDLPLHISCSQLKAVLYAAIETDVYGFTTK